MEDMVSFCGIDCNKCDAFIALRRGYSLEKRKAIAEKWARQYGGTPRGEDISCEGCTSSGKLFKHCKVCWIRKCGMGKGIRNCAYCGDYPCRRLSAFLEHASKDAKPRLDSIRDKIKRQACAGRDSNPDYRLGRPKS